MNSTPGNTTSYAVLPIASRLPTPTPEDVLRARKAASLTQDEAARLITPASTSPHRVWQGYEATVGSKAHRKIPLALWELFLLMTNQHPEFQLMRRTKTGA